MTSRKVVLWTIGGLLVVVLLRVATYHLQIVPALEELRDGGERIENTEFGMLGDYTARYLVESDALRMLPLARWLYVAEAVSGLWLLIGLLVSFRKPKWGMMIAAPAPLLTLPLLWYLIPTVGEDLFAYHYFFTIPNTTSTLAPMVSVIAYFFVRRDEPEPD